MAALEQALAILTNPSWHGHTPEEEAAVAIVCAEVKRLQRKGTPGVMHEVDKAFYDLTVQQRNRAWAQVDQLQHQLEDARYAPLGDNHHNAAACPYCGDLIGKERETVAQLRQALNSVQTFLSRDSSARPIIDAVLAGSVPAADRTVGWEQVELTILKHVGPDEACDAVLALKQAGFCVVAPLATDTASSNAEMWCDRCKRHHGVVWSVPSDVWNAVMREGDRANGDEFTFCCPTCFMQLADERDIGNLMWVIAPDPLRGPYVTVDRLLAAGSTAEDTE